LDIDKPPPEAVRLKKALPFRGAEEVMVFYLSFPRSRVGTRDIGVIPSPRGGEGQDEGVNLDPSPQPSPQPLPNGERELTGQQ